MAVEQELRRRRANRSEATTGVVLDVFTLQHSMSLEYTSVTKLTKQKPASVHTCGKSAAHPWSGRLGRSQARLTRSG